MREYEYIHVIAKGGERLLIKIDFISEFEKISKRLCQVEKCEAEKEHEANE